MSFKQDSTSAVQSLKSCEMYSIKDDQWTELPPMNNARQSFSICHFNEKFLFVFGGKVLSDDATLKRQAYDFVSSVEVFD